MTRSAGTSASSAALPTRRIHGALDEDRAVPDDPALPSSGDDVAGVLDLQRLGSHGAVGSLRVSYREDGIRAALAQVAEAPGHGPAPPARSSRAAGRVLYTGVARFEPGGSMDFTLTPEQETFRAEVRAWLSVNLPPDWASRPVVSRGTAARGLRLLRHWQRKLHEAGFVGLTWPKEYGGRGLTFMEEMILHAGDGAPSKAPPVAQHPRPRHGRPDDHRVRHRRAEAALPAEDPHLRGDLVPGLLRAQRGLRPRLAPDPRRQGRRPLRRQRPEGVDVARAHRRLDDAAGPHRSRARPSTRASPTSCSTCTRPASPCGRSSRSPATRSSTRCSSTTCACPRRRSWARSTTAGRSGITTLMYERLALGFGLQVRLRIALEATARARAPDGEGRPPGHPGPGDAAEARAAVDRHRGVQVHRRARDHQAPARASCRAPRPPPAR